MTEETIFTAAVGKVSSERAAFLDEACGENPMLRRRVEVLLAAHDMAGDFLKHPVVAPFDHAATREFGDGYETHTSREPEAVPAAEVLGFLSPASRPDSLGRLDHYEVLEILGRGGFGIVFRAFDEKLQRVVAIKMLAPEMAATSPARKRFLREAHSSAKITHENVVQVHDIEEEPLPYLVMEFIAGESLQQRIDRTGPLELPEVLRIGRQLAEGLAAAHEKELIHRDIKPANVLLESRPHQRVKLTDFGLARAADDASISQSGIVAGTPMYMAPEQAKGEALDHRADLFSLGSVLYAMATGRPPFRANTTLAVLKRVAEETPRPIREIIPETPDWFCRIVDKLHAKDPAERFQTAREVAELLGLYRAHLQQPNVVPMPAPVDVRLDALNKAAEEWFAGPGRPRPGRIAVYSGVVLFVSIAVLVLWRLDQLDWVSPPALVPTVGISGILAVPFILCFWWLSKAPVDKLGLHKKNGPSFAARRTGRRQAVTAALALAVVLLLGGVWFGRAAMLYLTNQGELELVPQDGLASLIVLKNDEGVIDENKLNPMVTDWLGMKTSHILKLPPGKYQLNAGTRSPGPRIIYWEVTTSGPRGSNHLLVPGEGAMGWTVMVTVERGERVRVRPVLANESSTSPSLPEVRWVELFNSKDLTGWRIPPEQPGNWKVENGELVGRSPAASYLFTEVGAYEDFRFRAEVKINRTGNAGVFVRAPLEGFKFDSPAGYEADLTFVAGRPNSPLGSLWKQEKRLQKALDSEPGPDQWFLLEVIATGPRLQVLVNHKLVTDYTDPAPSARKGHIVLQAIDEGTEVRFRRIEIEEFPPKTIEVKP